MRHYLDLVLIQAKVQKKQNRMTKICIFLSVFLIMGLFGMADMQIKSQELQAIQKDGNWHVVFQNLTEEQIAFLEARPEVEASGRYHVMNYGVNEGWQTEGIETVLCGMDETMMDLLPAVQITEGENPFYAKGMAACSDSMRDRLGLKTGSTILITSPSGENYSLTVSGFFRSTSMLTEKDAFALYTNMDTFRAFFKEGSADGQQEAVYVRFVPFCRVQKVLAKICEQIGISQETVGQNAYLLGLKFQSTDSYLVRIYLVVGVLALFVVVAGVLMITGSLNSSVARRTEFFGLMRCLGATPGQVARFVRREALGWCRTAVLAALLAGTIVIWCLCGLLRILSPGIFGKMPVFGISWIGLLSGAVLGTLTVLLSARAPARLASKVQPLTAVSGNAGTTHGVRSSVSVGLLHVETILGFHHAKGSKKNFLLMSGSFAFSVLLFLSFTSLNDFVGRAFTPLRPEAADISITSPDNTCSIAPELAERLSEHPSVRKVYGRSLVPQITAAAGGQEYTLRLASYEEHQFQWAKADLAAGTVEPAKEGTHVLVSRKKELPIEAGDQITIRTEKGTWELPVSGVLDTASFGKEPDVGTVICSEELFRELTGQEGYTVIDLQVRRGTTDAEAGELRALAGEGINFSDKRLRNMETMGAYYAFLLFLYGFLTVILMISAFHIMNSMSMSVSARFSEYQSLYAVGMSRRQLLSMTAAEAFSYLGAGLLAGLPAGFYSHRLLFGMLVASRWGDPWRIPVPEAAVVTFLLLLATGMSLLEPARRIRQMS